jgi:hypothetical protein
LAASGRTVTEKIAANDWVVTLIWVVGLVPVFPLGNAALEAVPFLAGLAAPAFPPTNGRALAPQQGTT